MAGGGGTEAAPEPGNEALIAAAAETGDVAVLDKEIRRWSPLGKAFFKLITGQPSAQPADIVFRGSPILHWAACADSADAVRHLVSKYKADVNVKNDEGETALLFAARRKLKERGSEAGVLDVFKVGLVGVGWGVGA